MTTYISKRGEIGTREYWETELDKFWCLFKGRQLSSAFENLPKRPANAWERYAKLLGLEEVHDESDGNICK